MGNQRYHSLAGIALLLLALGSLANGEECIQDENCHLPDCFCPTFVHPLGAENIPQIVYFGFDDAVTPQVSNYYDSLFTKDRKNPNGCPITMTLYISDQYTMYDLASKYYQDGSEMGVHSVTHTNIDTATKLFEEAAEQKLNIEKGAKVPANDITGWRSPNLKTAGDDQPRVLQQLNYTYDNSLSYDRDTNVPFPFTLDYGYPYPCDIQPCPSPDSKHKGFWEVMIRTFTDPVTSLPCVYVDACRPGSEDAAVEYLWTNFLNTYENKRAPFGLNMHAAWFAFPGYLPAMERFVDRLLTMDDVYIVSVDQMIRWMKTPKTLSEIKNFAPWGCDKARTTRETLASNSNKQDAHPVPKRPTVVKPPTAAPKNVNSQSHDRGDSNLPHYYHRIGVNGKTPIRTDAKPSHRPTLPVTSPKPTPKRPVLPPSMLMPQGGAARDHHAPQPNSCVQGANCRLPKCFCKTTSPPMGLAPKEIPQLVYLAIDAHIDGKTYEPLMQIFAPYRINSNGCRATGSIFVPATGNYPPYASSLRNIGARLGIRLGKSAGDKSGEDPTVEDVIETRRSLLARHGLRNVGVDGKYFNDVVKALHAQNTTFDNNFIANEIGSLDHSWPYTRNNGATGNPSYAAMWKIDLSPLRVPGDSGTCLSRESCPLIFSSDRDTYWLLTSNFNRHYYTTRSPFGITIDEDWLVGPNAQARLVGLGHFLDQITKKPDVMLVSVDKMLHWMRSAKHSEQLLPC